MADKTTFVSIPIQMETGYTASVRAALTGVQKQLGAHQPTPAESAVLWHAMSDWCNRNITALEGATSSGGAKGAIGGGRTAG